MAIDRRHIAGTFLVATALVLGPAALWASPEQKRAELLIKLVAVGRKVVSDHQALINDAGKGDKGFTPDYFAQKVVAEYQKATGIDLTRPTGPDSKLLATVLDLEKEVVAEAQPVINMTGMGFKGFIPAVFVRKAGEKITARTGIKMKFTATEFRNPRNAPDEFEQKVFSIFGSSSHTRGKPYVEVVQADGRKAYRYVQPEYAAKSCLSCHGEPRGEKDITGGRKEGQKEGDLAGAYSLVIPVD